MPLPPDSSLALFPQKNATRHAYILRMSQDAFDAVAAAPAQPQIQFDLGDNPGFYIENRFYPLRTSDLTNHELYLRTSSAVKKNAPLKLYASIVGKLTVDRDVDSVNERTRPTLLNDAPPVSTASRQLKGINEAQKLFRKPLRPVDKPKPVQSSAPVAGPSKQPLREINPHLRRQVIHILALGEKTHEQVTTAVSASSTPTSPPPTSSQILDAILAVAEPSPVARGQSSKPSTKLFRLMPSSWTEVRPYEWQGLSDNDRTSISRAGRVHLKALGIPESDPAWDHVRFRGSSTPSTNSSATPHSSRPSDKSMSVMKDAAKRGSVQSTKDRRTTKVKTETPPMKSESPRATTSNTPHRRTDSSSDPNGKRPLDRKLPAATDLSTTALRGSKVPRDSSYPPDDRDRDERKRDPLNKMKKTTRDQTPPVKRKIEPDEDHETSSNSGTKKRKIEGSSAMARTTSSSLSRPIKQEDPTKPTTLRRDAPIPIQKSHSDESSRDRRMASSTKSRPVPVYTSSEDEGEEEPRAPTRPPKASTSRPAAAPPAAPPTNGIKPGTKTVPRALPTDHAALRAMYDTSYVEYLDSFQRLVAQRNKMDRLLKRGAVDRAGSITDSDSDTQLLSPDEFERLKASHDNLRNELESIQQIFGRSSSR